jgi:ABC-type dipeptide/oligopeptide/nickel transport system ATPase component
MADRVAVMYHGKIVECGPVDSVLDTPSHAYTRALIAAAPSLSSL